MALRPLFAVELPPRISCKGVGATRTRFTPSLRSCRLGLEEALGDRVHSVGERFTLLPRLTPADAACSTDISLDERRELLALLSASFGTSAGIVSYCTAAMGAENIAAGTLSFSFCRFLALRWTGNHCRAAGGRGREGSDSLQLARGAVL